MDCQGCGQALGAAAILGPVCGSCVKARHRAAVVGRCVCRAPKWDPAVMEQDGRVRCDVCLGLIVGWWRLAKRAG